MRIMAIISLALAGLGCLAIGTDANRAAAAPNTQGGANMTEAETVQNTAFEKSLPKDFEYPADEAGKLLLREYGAVFVAQGGVTPPRKVVFQDEADVKSFQSTLATKVKVIAGTRVELQTAAMDALETAIQEAAKIGLSIGPRGADSSRRGYDQTVGLWKSRVEPGLRHWVAQGRVSKKEAERINSLMPYQQVPEILNLEKENIWFAKDLSKSIIYSVAPPGTSQHISMLALDVKQFDSPQIRAILARNGWHQTVASDLPHFTFLGVSTEDQLRSLGLKPVVNTSRTFWVPDIAMEEGKEKCN